MTHYARFVDLWEDADPGFQPEVERIWSTISRLTEAPRGS
jgi:hypothetical protein